MRDAQAVLADEQSDEAMHAPPDRLGQLLVIVKLLHNKHAVALECLEFLCGQRALRDSHSGLLKNHAARVLRTDS